VSEREKFEKWWEEFRADHEELRFADREALLFGAWQAALSTRKPYGYGIVDKDGKFAGAYKRLVNANDECDYKNEEVKDIPPLPGYPFRVVELFYEDQS
jgi:hypothetical protein